MSLFTLRGDLARRWRLKFTHIFGPSREGRMTIAQRFNAGNANGFTSRVPEGRLNRSTVPPGLG